MPQFSFTIDLACLASRRDFLKLDKWIDDKLAQHGVRRFIGFVITFHFFKSRKVLGNVCS